MKQIVDRSQFAQAVYDLPYADASPSQKLDIVYPEVGQAPYPVVVFFHGGGFVGGGKDDFTIAFVFKLLAGGYAVASANYRFALEAPWPAQIFDAKAAIRYLRAHARQLKLDTDRLAVAGNSAGGTLAQLIAATGGRPVLEDLSQGNAAYSSRAQALISWYGLSDFEQDAQSPGTPADIFCRSNGITEDTLKAVWAEPVIRAVDVLLRRKGAEDLPAVRAMNPGSYVTADFPPALFQHGLADPVVPSDQSEAMARKVNEACGPGRVLLDLFPDAGHGAPVFKSHENIERCLQFLQEHIPSGYQETPQIREIGIVSVE